MPDNALDTLGLNQLAIHVQAELDDFHNRLTVDGRYGFALFKRAFVDGHERAWDHLFRLYKPQVVRWVRRHPHFAALNEDADDFAVRSLLRMWRSMTPEKFAKFQGLPQLLCFLTLCVHCEIVQEVRTRARLARLEVVQPGGMEDDAWTAFVDRAGVPQIGLEDQHAASTLWEYVQDQLKTDQERAAVEYTFVFDLPPRQIASLFPALFADAAEVSQVKDNVRKRLRRDADLASEHATRTPALENSCPGGNSHD